MARIVIWRIRTLSVVCRPSVQLGGIIYVLHAFQKKSSTGIKTAKYDIDLIKQRYNEAKELAKDEQETK